MTWAGVLEGALVFAVLFVSFATGCLFTLWLIRRQHERAHGGNVVIGPWRRT